MEHSSAIKKIKVCHFYLMEGAVLDMKSEVVHTDESK